MSSPMTLQLVAQAPQDPIDVLTNIRPAVVLWALAVVAATWLLITGIARLLDALSRRAPRARFFFKLMEPALRFVAWSLAAFVILTIFTPSRETLIAVLASVGIALAIGAQDLVKNVVGGLVILVDRPYQLGDRVRIGDAYGEVDHIGLRSTKLTTPEDTRVTIPNSEVLTGQAWNSNSGVPESQVVTDLFLPADTDPIVAREIAYEAVYTSPFILLTRPVTVLVQDRFQEVPYLLVRVKAYVYDHGFEPRLQSDITVRAKTEFLRRNLVGPGWARRHEAALGAS